MLPLWLKHYDLLIFDRIDSTNSEALRLAKSGVIKSNLVIIAKEQTTGRGTKGNNWESITGNLHMSILLQSRININRITELSFLTAIALYEAIQKLVKKSGFPSIDIKLKWPNDVLISGRKFAGILLESIYVGKKNYLVVGIGVNTHFVPSLPDIQVTSLFNEGIVLKNSDYFLNNFMEKFQSNYSKWIIEDNFHSIRAKWLKLAYNLDRIITLDNGVQKISGIFRGIDQRGAICIELPDGKICSFSSGRVLSGSKTTII